MHKKLVLIGGGGHCKSVLDTALSSGDFAEIVITDSKLPKGVKILECPVIGTDDSLPLLKNQGFTYAFITVGSIKDTTLRKSLVEKTENLGFDFPIIIDSSAIISKHVQIEKGTFIGKNVVINADAKIGKHCIINTGSIIEHNSVIGPFTHVAVGAILCGDVQIGHDSFIGAGATIIQGKKIGDYVTIGAGSTVLGNIQSGEIQKGIIK